MLACGFFVVDGCLGYCLGSWRLQIQAGGTVVATWQVPRLRAWITGCGEWTAG